MKYPKNFDNLSVEEQLEWYKRSNEILEDKVSTLTNQVILLNSYTQEKQRLFDDFCKYTIDPTGQTFNVSLENILQRASTIMGKKVAAIDSAGGINYANHGWNYDPFLIDFIHGSGGIISSWEREQDTDNALVIRGLGGGSRKAIKHCWETRRTFYAIDTGYFGNGKSKFFHRVTKNALQNLGPIIPRSDDRLKKMGYSFRKFKRGSKILICPPSEKVMMLWGQPTPEEWVNQVIADLKRYTDRPIEVRLKPSRSARVNTDTIESALADDVHCLITYNSIAATEALIHGKPAITLGPNAASMLCNTSLSTVENLHIPSRDEMMAFMCHLSYCQFSVNEFKSGYAWEIVNENNA